jgi:hypothetical protein
MQRQARVFQPLCQGPNRGSVVVIKVRPSGEDFNAIEAMSGDLEEVVPIELLIVIQVCGEAKARVHREILAIDDTRGRSSGGSLRGGPVSLRSTGRPPR